MNNPDDTSFQDAGAGPGPAGPRSMGLPTDPPPAFSPDPGAGRLHDLYHLDRELGRGGTGVVYHAVRRSDGREVAIKLLRRERRGDDILVLRHVLEGRYLERIDHSHVVAVHDTFSNPRELAIIMEFVDGTSLRALLDRGPVPSAEAYRLLGQVAAGLVAVHGQGLVHRDIKPENVLVTERDGGPRAVITDFGIAYHRFGPRLTRTGPAPDATTVIGTYEYIAPELWGGGMPTGAADCYALGVMAYEMLARRRPFEESGFDELRAAHQLRTPSRPPGLPDGGWLVMLACLAKQPADRPDAELLVRCFTELSADPTARPLEPGSFRRSSSSRRAERSRAGGHRATSGHDGPNTTLGGLFGRTGRSVGQLRRAADDLAGYIWRQWSDAASARGLSEARPIPVRWHWSRRPVTGPIEGVFADPAGRAPFAPLPGTALPTAKTISQGGLADLFDIYAGLGSGRLIILGSPGSGKSSAAILTVLDALAHRMRHDDAARAAIPVPVLLTTYGWDPRRRRLDDWFIDQLATTYPFLRSRRYGRNAAETLVRDGLVSCFLDGFDEMSPQLRPHALRVINRHTRTFRLVVLTRVGEFVAAVESGHLHDAAALELDPVAAHEATGHIRHRTISPLPTQWRRLVDHLEEHPDGVLARALDSPLNLKLLRDSYPDPADLDQLLDRAQDPATTRDDVEDMLLDRVVPAAYRNEPAGAPGRYDLRQAGRALGRLASEMNSRGTRDLAWWGIHRWSSPVPRVLASGILGAITMALVGALAFGPLGRYTVDGATGTRFGSLYGSGMGLVFGLLAGLTSEARMARPSRAPRFNPAIALLVGLAVTLAVGNQTQYVFGIPAGIAVGGLSGRAAIVIRLVTGRRIWRAIPLDAAAGLTAGVAIGLAYGFTKDLAHGLAAGLVGMFMFGLMVGIVRPVASTETSTTPASSWKRDQRRALSFGLACALPTGFALGTVNGLTHGIGAGVVAGIGFGLVIAIGGIVGIADSWRATLTFLQMRHHGGFPACGMRFLKEAHDRGVLRTVGPIYQFRHARLQDRLAETYHSARKGRAEDSGVRDEESVAGSGAGDEKQAPFAW